MVQQLTVVVCEIHGEILIVLVKVVSDVSGKTILV